MISVKSFEFNAFAENTLVLYDETREAVIIDPGCYSAEEQNALTRYIEVEQLKVTKLLNTHGHIDHVLGNSFVKDVYGVELYMHETELTVLASVASYAPAYGFEKYQPATVEHFLKEGDRVTFGTSSLEVVFVPGHSPGHVAFVDREQKICIGGDVLFQGSIGRTDLPGGNFDTLIDSIKSKMFLMDDDTVIYPGHGPTTTIGFEKQHNPFVGQTPIA